MCRVYFTTMCDRKEFMSKKNPLTPAGIEPATFRFVAQHLNHCATAVPSTVQYKYQYKHDSRTLHTRTLFLLSTHAK